MGAFVLGNHFDMITGHHFGSCALHLYHKKRICDDEETGDWLHLHATC